MKAHIQILSTGTVDCPASIAIHFDSQRYLINCGEGTQRLGLQSRFRLIKIKTMLFTRTHWDCMGGAPGLLLTLADGGGNRTMLLGGENLTHALISTRFFVYRPYTNVDTYEFSKDRNTYKDDLVRITAVQAYPENFVRAEPYEWPEESVYHKATPPRRPSTQEASTSPMELENVVSRNDTAASEAATAGSKRNSDELQSAPLVAESDPEDPQEIRKKILRSMFTGSTPNQPLTAKKPKRNPCAETQTSTVENSAETAALTDVDLIAARNVAEANNPTRFSRLPRTSPDPTAISYIFQAPDYAGKFNPQAAMALNVPKGKSFSELVKGNPVLSESGETVYPHQVISGARPGRVVMIIDCPTVDYISSLVNAKEFERYQDLESTSDTAADKLKAEFIVHLGGHAILSHPKYKAWMERFGPETEHVVAHEDYCSQKLIWRSQSRSSYKLSALDPTIFPVPYYNNTPGHDLAKDLSGLPIKANVAESLLSYSLEPTVGWDRSEVVEPLQTLVDPEDFEEESPGEMKQFLKDYYGLAEKAKEDIAKDLALCPEVFPGMDISLTTLGTGSSHPSKYRNVSATLLDMNNDGTFFLDIGEGTYGQMFRQFGGYERSADQKDSVDDRLKRLKGIFISHLHADHHLGTVTIIDRWNKLRKPDSEPLYLIAPFAFDTFLRDLSDVFDFGYKNVQFIHCDDVISRHGNFHSRKQRSQSRLEKLLKSSGLSDLATVEVIHCKWAYGISLTHMDGWKVVYSGDTRPCNNLVDAGQGATVLLHEATFEDDKKHLAVVKKHSTTQEAIMVGEGMEARHTLLTHFSQRYPKIPQIDSENKATVIGVCFDQMTVRLGQIAQLPKFLPALQVLFSDEAEEGDDGEEIEYLQQGME
ncbi:MAG: beta-lactamase-like protein [Benniella sp.]|nr:MAG: beta-lactamase-like protein [Benniella sp.]